MHWMHESTLSIKMVPMLTVLNLRSCCEEEPTEKSIADANLPARPPKGPSCRDFHLPSLSSCRPLSHVHHTPVVLCAPPVPMTKD
jgi:hypothetical protein